MISRPCGMMAEADASVGTDNESAGKLADISLGNAHPVPLGHDHQSFGKHAGGEQRTGSGPFKTESPEKPFFRIGNHGEGNIEALLERRRLLDAA